MIKRFNDERGIAMVTALMVSLVVLFLSIAVVALSLHNSNISSFDRKRIQAVGAAEAGIDAWLSGLTKATGRDVCDDAKWDATLSTNPSAAYDVSVTLYSAWPPIESSKMACPPVGQALPADPLGALIISKGTAVTSNSPVAVSRTMQSEVKLTPIYVAFNKAIFSSSYLDMQNKLTLHGYQGNDGDVYTNGDYTEKNNTEINGSVYAQGYADINSGVVRQNVWANGYVNLSGGIQVFGDTTSSTLNVSLNNATVFGKGKAGTTVSLSNNSTIKQGYTQNSPSGPPPGIPLPQIGYDQCAWTCAPAPAPEPNGFGYTEVSYSSCAAAKAFISAGAVGSYVVRVSPTCALTWTNNDVVNIKGNMAIVTDGSIQTQNQTIWNSVGGKWTLFFIRPYQTGLNCGNGNQNSPGPYDISFANNTNFSTNLTLFVYSQCNVWFGNNNAEGVNGQIIGGTVNITNQMALNYVPTLVPGSKNLIGYTAAPSYLREISNIASPTP